MTYPAEFEDIYQTASNTSDSLIKMLRDKKITPGEWFERMMILIERAYNLAAGAGSGLDELSPEIQAVIDSQVLAQEAFLRNFLSDIESGEWDDRYISRARMYVASSYSGYSHGDIVKQAGKVLPVPAYPTEGTQCLCISTGDSRVFTTNGYIPIKDITVGDYVLTHKLRWKMVTATHTRNPRLNEKYVSFEMPTGTRLDCTWDHKWLSKGRWETSSSIFENYVQNDANLTHVPEIETGNFSKKPIEVEMNSRGMYHGSETLYDLTVEDDHSFIIEGVITHNSNCKCFWDIDTLDFEKGNFDAYWKLGTDDNCQTCQIRATEWSPVRIRAGVLI